MRQTRIGLITLIAAFVCCAFAVRFAYSLTAQSPSSCTLTVKVLGIRNTEGNIRVVLRRDQNTIVETRTVEIDPKTLTSQTVFEKLPAGAYGVSVVHDENKNGQLDRNDLGVPVEGYGHSNNPTKRAGPPSFDETKITVSQPATSTEINLIYWL